MLKSTAMTAEQNAFLGHGLSIKKRRPVTTDAKFPLQLRPEADEEKS